MSDPTAYERWELPVVGPKMPRVRDVPTRPLTAAQIDDLQRRAYDEAATDGRQAGYEEGYRQGLEKANAQLLQSVRSVHNVCTSLSRPIEMVDESVVQSMLDVVLAVSRHVIDRELATHPEQIVDLINKAMKLVPIANAELSVYVNPADARVIRDSLEVGNTWRLVEDASITRGGCRVEQGACCVDATLEQRVEQLVSQLSLSASAHDNDR